MLMHLLTPQPRGDRIDLNREEQTHLARSWAVRLGRRPLQFAADEKPMFPGTPAPRDTSKRNLRISTPQGVTPQSIHEELFPGVPFDPHHYADIMGFPDDATVHFVFGRTPNTLPYVLGAIRDHPKIMTMMRVVRKGLDGPELHNDVTKLYPAAQGQGLGTDLFANQVRAARAAKIKRIRNEAIIAKAKRPEDRWNGAITWALLGYDGPLNQDALPPEFQGKVRTVQQLLHIPGGIQWWRKHAHDFKGTFDLSDTSPNLTYLNDYLRERGKPPIQ